MPPQTGRIKRLLYIAAGSFFFGLGALGIFVPVLPTTPFWLLTAYFYLNSSPVLYERVMRIPVFGRHIRCFREYRAIPLRGKIVSIAVLWLTSLISSWVAGSWWITTLLLLIAAGVTIHILTYPTLTKEMETEIKKPCPDREKDADKTP